MTYHPQPSDVWAGFLALAAAILLGLALVLRGWEYLQEWAFRPLAEPLQMTCLNHGEECDGNGPDCEPEIMN